MEENTYLNNESDSDDFESLNGKKKENQITRKTYQIITRTKGH